MSQRVPLASRNIIGGGLSGLYAAKILSHYKVPVSVLEAQERVGGRSFSEKTSITDGGYAIVDQGAGYVGSTQSVVIGLCEKLGIATHTVPDFKQGKYTFSLGGEVHHSYFPLADLFVFLKPIEFLAMSVTIIKTWSMGRHIPYDSPWTAPKAKDWDAMTVEN